MTIGFKKLPLKHGVAPAGMSGQAKAIIQVDYFYFAPNILTSRWTSGNFSLSCIVICAGAITESDSGNIPPHLIY